MNKNPNQFEWLFNSPSTVTARYSLMLFVALVATGLAVLTPFAFAQDNSTADRSTAVGLERFAKKVVAFLAIDGIRPLRRTATTIS